MHCFFSRLRVLPPQPQPTGNVLGSLSTPGCNWNKLVARWRNLRNLLLMIYFRVESLVCIWKVVLSDYVFLYFTCKIQTMTLLALILNKHEIHVQKKMFWFPQESFITQASLSEKSTTTEPAENQGKGHHHPSKKGLSIKFNITPQNLTAILIVCIRNTNSAFSIVTYLCTDVISDCPRGFSPSYS